MFLLKPLEWSELTNEPVAPTLWCCFLPLQSSLLLCSLLLASLPFTKARQYKLLLLWSQFLWHSSLRACHLWSRYYMYISLLPHHLKCSGCLLPQSVLLPRQAAKLPSSEDHCKCGPEWYCEPYNACFIHNSYFCKGSGSFPPIKPPCSSWSQFSYDWYIELASHLDKHPHSLLSHIVSEVEHCPFITPYYCFQPPA